MSYSTPQIRNVALAGHPGAGKTTLFEALLHAGGAIQAAGTIERGSTVSDTDPLERQRAHSIDAAIASLDHAVDGAARVHVNLLDTPGYPDFRGATLSALSAVETVAVVVDADAGIGHGTHRIMAHAGERGLCRAIVVNRIDHEAADCARLLDELRDAFGPEVLPVNLPADGGRRVVDCFAGDGGDSDVGPVADWHRRILDQVVEVDESVMDHYLDRGEAGLSGAELHAAFEQSLREGHLVPVCFVSARTGVGIAELLDVIATLFPHPGEANPPPFQRGIGEASTPVTSTPDPDAHVIADVFKIINDPFVGKLGIFRVHQGTVRRDGQLFVDDGRKPFKVAHLFRIFGKDHMEIEQAVPGDIAAVAKIDALHFDAVLHDSHDEDTLHLAPMAYPKPMFGLAVEAASKGQEQKLATALHKLSEEDPCFQVEHDAETGETVVRGLSELHLRVHLERLRERHGVEVTSRPPRIAYRETIAAAAEGHHRHKKQTGGAGQFGEVFLRVEPLPRGTGFEFVDAVKGGTIPGQFLPAVEKGVRQALGTGAIAGYPIQDVRVIVHDGKHHPVDSKEVAFVTAGRKAFLDAVSKAAPQVLEPIVDLVVVAPEDCMGDVSGGLASRRARILGTDSARGGDIVVKAQLPQSELEGYAPELKSATAGRGRYSLDFSHYEPVPAQLQHTLATAWKPRQEDD
ncbi:elongation factor G [Luteimonas sp. MC1572]|uniref:elongation factor G n=1 Tax=Luteimonas sp. MC1572 TaxID=2799325 RepID=UPI0018F0BCB5|nr:elongation factor G [Luteimonas sp. MC1572]MBJ6982568.1 elongation factor G [Luteimonas sp. MC1572]QQO03818.1 elongation factor G [Luteimonas sp. MC1572]